MLVKEEVFFNNKFRQKCEKYGIPCNKLRIIDNVIVLKNDDVYVLLDGDINTIGVLKMQVKNEKELEKIIKSYNSDYNNRDNIIIFPFINYRLKDICDVSNKINVYKDENGNNITEFDNINLEDKSYDYNDLLSYIKFINKKKEDYYLLCYQMNKLDIEMESIYVYLGNLISKLNHIIVPYTLKKSYPRVKDILSELGLGETDEETIILMENIINYLLRREGYEAGSYDGLKYIGKKDNQNVINATSFILYDYNNIKTRKLVLKNVVGK